MNTPGAAEQWHTNMPLWMRVSRYRDGFHSFNKFVKSGVWRAPPKPQLLEARPSPRRETRTQRLIRLAEAEEANRAKCG